jgi:hypothetical protein
MPEVGWSDAMIESFLAELSAMDSNNFNGELSVRAAHVCASQYVTRIVGAALKSFRCSLCS